ncbi:MAG: response regulator [Betaproteobacteria bacterium]
MTLSAIQQQAQDAALPARPRFLKVLVADDQRDAVDTLAVLLRDLGHEVRGVFNGNDVLRTLESFSADVVLLDIGMAGRDGYDTAREIVQRYGTYGPLLVATTGYNSPTDKLMAKIVGFKHHFPKPLDLDALFALLARTTAEKRDS